MKMIKTIKKIFWEMLPPFTFFFSVFQLFSISAAVLLKDHSLITPSITVSLVGALIIAKVILIANKLPFLNLYPRKPLIYNVVYKAIAFSAAALSFRLTEVVIRLGFKLGSVSAAWNTLMPDVNWEVFWIREIWIFLLIMLYCASVELVHVIGSARVKEIFFGTTKK